MSKLWTFPEDTFGAFVDANPSEIVTPKRNMLHNITAMHVAGAGEEKHTWLKQFKKTGWPKKPETIERLTKMILDGDFGYVVGVSIVTTEMLAFENGLKVLEQHTATKDMISENGEFLSFEDEAIPIATAASVAWLGVALGYSATFLTMRARAAGHDKSAFVIDNLPQQPQLYMRLLQFITDKTFIKNLWIAAGITDRQKEAGFHYSAVVGGDKIKQSFMACITDWVAASVGAMQHAWKDGDPARTEARRLMLTSLADTLANREDGGKLLLIETILAPISWEKYKLEE